MKSAIFLAAAAAVTISAPVAAQEGPATGGHVLVIAGLDSVDIEDNAEDVIYGLTAGYDVDVGGAFVGIEVEGSLSGVGEGESDLFQEGDRLEVDAARDLYIGARLGTMIGETTKVYVKGGYTNSGIDVSFNDGEGGSFKDTETLGGYRVGAGLEFLLGQRGVIRAEYRYSDYGETDLFGFATGIQIERHQGVVGVGIRF